MTDRYRRACFPRPPFSRAEERGDAEISTAPMSNEPRINDRIRAREVFLVDENGTRLGVKPLPEALTIAREAELDLVEVAANADPPVCRIMDYGKFKFDAAQRAKESRRKSSRSAIKQMNYRIKIGTGDFDTKTRRVKQFLNDGHKVKISVWFRGREVSHPELGKRLLDRIAEDVTPVGKVESLPKLDGRNLVMVLAPDRRAPKKEAGAPETPAAAAPPPPVDEPPTAEPPIAQESN
ncbi:MAG TPA: translation initiation factor IF-3 [Acidimicrobiales bacterium]|nr:translation initiation factor IF-3 [Acidimicrobiales bacterium]